MKADGTGFLESAVVSFCSLRRLINSLKIRSGDFRMASVVGGDAVRFVLCREGLVSGSVDWKVGD
jgi:hypothetical protein